MVVQIDVHVLYPEKFDLWNEQCRAASDFATFETLVQCLRLFHCTRFSDDRPHLAARNEVERIENF